MIKQVDKKLSCGFSYEFKTLYYCELFLYLYIIDCWYLFKYPRP